MDPSYANRHALQVCQMMSLAFQAQLNGVVLSPAMMAHIDAQVGAAQRALSPMCIFDGRPLTEVIACAALVALGESS